MPTWLARPRLYLGLIDTVHPALSGMRAFGNRILQTFVLSLGSGARYDPAVTMNSG
jgi:hypothetical protein